MEAKSKEQPITVSKLPMIDKKRALDEAKTIEGCDPISSTEALMELSNNAIIIVDPNEQTILLRNQKFKAIFPSNEQTLSKFLPTETRTQINIGKRELPREIIITEEGKALITNISVKSIIHNEQVVWLIEIIVVEKSPSTSANETELLLDEIARLRAQIEKEFELRGRIQHDVVNMLFIAESNASMLSMDTDDPEISESLNVISRGVNDACRLFVFLLAPNKESEFEPQELDRIVVMIKSLLSYWEKTHGIKIEINIDDGNYRCEVNEPFIVNMIMNILTNAKNVTPNGGSIHVSLSEMREQNSIRICIEDSGPGIPDHILKKAFMLGVTTKEDSGHGVGLHSVMEAVTLHNGNIDIDTKTGPDSFTKVSITIPKLNDRSA